MEEAPAYSNEQISPVDSVSKDEAKDIEAGEKGMKIEEQYLGITEGGSNNVEFQEMRGDRSYNIYWKIGHVLIWLVMTGYGHFFTLMLPISN